MLQYTNHQLSIIIAIPIISILTVWTVAIFHKNRRSWKPYDITIVAVLVQSMLRQMAVFCYTMLTILQHNLNADFCTPSIWIFNCLHTFQASSLTTLALIGLFSIKLHRKQQNIKQFLTVTHIVYHLFCLTALCACVGVAAILARHDWPTSEKSAVFEFEDAKFVYNDLENCKFMPYQLDVKYNVFVIALLAFLAIISVCAFVGVVYNYYKMKYAGFDYLKKSTSDLSDLSLGAAASVVSPSDVMQKNFYDTYTKGATNLDNSYMKRFESQNTLNKTCLGQNQLQNTFITKDGVWNSDTSNISTSVSSTNSRRPCLNKPKEEEDNGAGLETVLPVLIVCYLFYHLPVVVLCTFPWIIAPWPVAGAALWLGVLQDLLIPVGLGLVDSRFCNWVAKVYRCTDRQGADKLPHGVDGKFRHFGSQPQSLEIINIPGQQERLRTNGHHAEHKFPITNGSLYTSIDGRVPVIHNYRRHKGPNHNHALSMNMGLHSTHIKRQEFILNHPGHYEHLLDNQNGHFDSAFISLPSEYASINGNQLPYTADTRSNLHLVLNQNHLKPSLRQQKPTPIPRNLSASQGSLNSISIIENDLQKIRNRNLLGALSKSQDSLTEFNKRHQQTPLGMNETQRDIQMFKQNPTIYEKPSNVKSNSYESSDEEFFDESLHNNQENGKNFDTLSSQSCYSITTEANCDFDFYGQSNNVKTAEPQSFQFKNDTGESSDTMSTANMFVHMAAAPQTVHPHMHSFKPIVPPKPLSYSQSQPDMIQNSFANTRTMDVSRSQPEMVQQNNFMNVPMTKVLRSSSKRSSVAPTAVVCQDLNHNYRITRSNSKRSLENFQAFINEDKIKYVVRQEGTVKRSNSCVSIDANHNINKRHLSRSNSKCSEKVCLRDGGHNINRDMKRNLFRRQMNQNRNKKNNGNCNPVLSMESLSSVLSRGGISYLDNGDICNHNYGGSVPDFKKIFVSDYI